MVLRKSLETKVAARDKRLIKVIDSHLIELLKHEEKSLSNLRAKVQYSTSQLVEV